MSGSDCPFCSIPAERVFHRGQHIFAIWDAFAVSDGHALLIPNRHVATWFDASDAERAELMAACDIAREAIVRRRQDAGMPSPDGFNIGINVGEAAGQTVFHLHVHVIPRYRGDVPDPRGGVRHVIPSKANYLAAPRLPSSVNDAAEGYSGSVAHVDPHPRLLTGGRDNGLLAPLLDDLDAAHNVEIAVAFLFESGVRSIQSCASRSGRWCARSSTGGSRSIWRAGRKPLLPRTFRRRGER